ncbi:hypothetical protein BD779DRAFT_614289 [Infundibulicybe gibba]|nr:hypothetical protein BD779DRAFT_614289 [Infundibulicybe gibba]
MAPPALPLPDPSVPGFVGEADDLSYAPSFRRGTVYEDQDATVRASRAGAYLRHVTSAPHMRGATVVGGSRRMRKNRNVGRGLFVLNDGSEEEDGVDGSGKGKQGMRGNGEGEDEPRITGREKIGWLGFVTRAVGGTRASSSGAIHPQFHLPSHRGGPGIQDGRTSVPYARAGLRQTRSSLSQVSLVSRRSVGGKYLAPPSLVIHARGSVGPEVTRARVVCRSAPGSREGSPERKRDRTASQLRKGQGRVPSLARTSTSVDGEGQLMWDQVADRNKAAVEEDADIGSEEDGEVTLAKILVPPKRQNSIRSLRKHLPPALGIAYLPQGEVVARRRSNKEPEEEEWVQWGQGWRDEGAKSRKRPPK